MGSSAKKLGESIQYHRKLVGFTQDELSDRAGLSYSTLAKIERGAIKNPSIFTVTALAGALNCTIEELLMIRAVQSRHTKTGRETFLYCDINGVLVRFFQRAFVQVAHQHNVSLERVETAFWHYNDAANRGEMSIEMFNKVMSDQLHIDNFDWGSLYLETVEPIKEMHRCVEEVSKTSRVGLLSNIHQGLIPKMIKQGLLPDIEYATIVDSSQVGAIKPEARIYEIAEKMAGVGGDQIFFVDDSRTNLMAAERFGWRVMWFDDYRPTDSVKRVKEALGVNLR
jgi:2-haloacid dehalogenase